MSEQSMIEADGDQRVTFLIKNPSKHDESFTLSVSLSSSVADIQRKLAEEYDGKPSPSSQTLIYAGKVLKDTKLTVKDIIKQPAELNVPHSMHLVIRAPVMKAPSSPGLSSNSTQPVHGTLSAGPTRSTPSPAPASAASSAPATPAAEVAGSTQPSASTTGSLQQPAGTSPAASEAAVAPTDTASNSSTHMFEFGLHGSAHTGNNLTTSPFADLPLTSTAMPCPYMFFNPMNISAMNVSPVMSPVMNNQVMATAYQAAYSAALQSMRQQMQVQAGTAAAAAAAAPSSGSTAAAADGLSPGAPHILPLTPPLTPAAVLYYPAAYQQAAAAAAMAAAAAAQQGHQTSLMPPAAAQFPLPAPFAVPVMGMPAHLATHPGPAQQAAAAAGNAAAPAGRIGLRQRFPNGFNLVRLPGGINQAAARQDQQAAAPAAQQGGGHAHPHGHRRYRTRTITFRISMRTLLQMLVFGMVLYQHCTWPRLCILLAGSIILYATALWAPFRQFILSLAMPLRPEQLAEVQRRRQQQQQAAMQQQQQQQQPGPQAAEGIPEPAAGEAQQRAGAVQQQQRDAAAAAPGAVVQAVLPEAAQAPQGAATEARAAQPAVPAWLQQGVVREVLTLLVSFVTSLLPAWNHNPEDAAVFAAAQDMIAREAREQQQQRQPDAAGANHGDADAAAAAAAVP